MTVQLTRPPAPVAPPVAHPSSSVAKAGPIGPGAGVLMTEFLLPNVLPQQPNQRMRKAWQLGQSVGYVFGCERVISGKLSGMAPLRVSASQGATGWHLEDPDGNRVDDTHPDQAVRAAWQLLADPMGALSLQEAGGMRQSRRQQWGLTSRHMGLCGQGAWVLDGLNDWGLPRAILYCRPDRLTVKLDAQGVLDHWALDVTPANPDGIRLELSEVQVFYLQAPDEGYWATGLVEAALAKAQLNGAIDRYFGQVISGGGRLSGILAPRQGIIEDETTYQQLVRDWRNVTEMPEAAKRLQVVRAPVDFTRTVNTPMEMGLIDLMGRNRDDLLALWGVPYSQVGGSPAAGMGQGEARDSDRQALWENAVMPRGDELQEGVQDILNRLLPLLGWAPQFVWDWPDLEPSASRWDAVQKTGQVALRNRERRGLMGLEPFGDDVYGTTGQLLDDEVWVPMSVSPVTAAVAGYRPEEPEPPEPAPGTTPATDQADEDQAAAEDEGAPTEQVGAAKARLGVAHVRAAVTDRVVPELTKALRKVLHAQRDDVADRVAEHWDAITAKPNDATTWWRKGGDPTTPYWDAQLSGALRPALAGVAEVVGDHLADQLGPKPAKALGSYGAASRTAVEYALHHGSGRITRINDWTREGVRKLIGQAIDQGMSALDASALVRGWSGWDEYRAERIARTETMFAYNAGALATYSDYGVQQVEAIDGDDDEECAERNGQVYPVDVAVTIVDHPNGTLDWAPVVPDR